jgi:AAA+ superfamily predicted ATPase
MERMNYLGCDAVLFYTRSEGVLFPNVGLRNGYQSAYKLSRIEEIEPLPDPPEGQDTITIKNINAGLRHIGEEKMVREPQEMMSLIESFFRQGMGNLQVGFLVQDMDKLLPNHRNKPLSGQEIVDIETWQRWAVDLQFKARGHIILLLTENISNVAPELLVSDGLSPFPIEIPMPTYQERLAFIRHLLYIPEAEGEEGKYKLDLPEKMLSEEFAAMTHGLNLLDIQNLWMTGKTRKTVVSLAMVVQQNRESIKKRSYGRLELVYGEHGLNTVGGLDQTIDYIGNIINSLKNWDAKSVPRGILMVGPPGTGKTNLINALADLGVHIVKLCGLRGSDPATRGDWDLHRALNIVHSLTPVIAFIDDIDKIEYYTGTDENERRLMNQLLDDLLRFMRDPVHRGRVLWIGASNRPDLIHPEFRRQGTLDDVIPFLPPDVRAREDILRKIFPRNAIPYDVNINFGTVATKTERCTGGDLELIMMRSFKNARLSNRDTVIEEDLIKAADEFVPPRDPNMDEYLMLIAIREASLSPLIPRQLPGALNDRVYENNVINKTKVNQRIRELEVQLNIQGRR